jgi:hypothetical protein
MKRQFCLIALGASLCLALPACRTVGPLETYSRGARAASPAGLSAARLGYAPETGYDFDTLLVSHQEDIYRKGCGSYVLNCVGFVDDEGGQSQRFHLRGIVSPIEVDGKTYFISAGHVFDIEEQMAIRGCAIDASSMQPPEYFLELRGSRHDLQRIDTGKGDVALFVHNGRESSLLRGRYRCGNSDEVSLGNPVLSWGMPLMEDFELSVGIVSALTAPRSLMGASYPEAASEDFFVTSIWAVHGCSGALVYAFREGEPEIIGMLVAGYRNINRSIVYKINAILRDCGLRR